MIGVIRRRGPADLDLIGEKRIRTYMQALRRAATREKELIEELLGLGT